MKKNIFIGVAIGVAMLIASTINLESSQAADSWKDWSDLRWKGLIQFSKNNFSDASAFFDKALKEAKRIQPESEYSASSLYDMALVYRAEGDDQKAEEYCNEVLKLTKKVCPHSGLQTLALLTLASIRRDEHRLEQVRNLNDEIVKMNNEDPQTQCVAQAEMRADGDIDVTAYSDPHTCTRTQTSDPDYRDLLMHIGPLSPEHAKPIVQWPEKASER